MKKILQGLFLILVVLMFFWQTFFWGKLPVPSDALVGMYHPWRDSMASEYQRGFPFKNSLITDPVRQQIPWKKQSIDAWKEGHMPSWNSLSGFGTTLVGNIQAGSFYPLNVLFFLFPFSYAWTILVISQPVLSSLFMFLFLRKKQLNLIPSLIGSLCFSFGGYAMSWLTWGTIVSTFLWVPLMFLSVDGIKEGKKKWIWSLVLLFSLLSSFFAGHIQLFFYALCLLCWYMWWECRKEGEHVFFPLLVSLLVFLAVASFQFLPLLSFFLQTSRGAVGADWMSEGFFIPVYHLVQFFAPDYFGNPATGNYWGVWNYGEMIGYIGVAGLVFSIFGMMSKKTVRWTIPFIVSLVFAVSSPIAELPFRFHMPILSGFQPTRLLAVAILSLSILAAYGIEFISKTSWKKICFVCAGFLIFVCFLWMSVYVPSVFHISSIDALVSRRNIYLPTAVLVIAVGCIGSIKAFAKKKQAVSLLLFFLFFISVCDLYRFGWKFTPFTDAELFFPVTKTIQFLEQQKKPYRILSVDERLLPPNTQAYFGIESVAQYDPLMRYRFEEFMAAFERGKPDITPPFGFNRIVQPKNIHSPLFPLVSAQFVLSLNEIHDPQCFEKVFEEGETKIYTYSDALPRVYAAERVIIRREKQDIINELFTQVEKGLQFAVVESDIPLAGLSGEADVSISSYDDTNMEIKTNSTSDIFLVVTNSYDKRWKAYVDGEETEIYPANYVFMGFVVPGGSHTVTLLYE